MTRGCSILKNNIISFTVQNFTSGNAGVAGVKTATARQTLLCTPVLAGYGVALLPNLPYYNNPEMPFGLRVLPCFEYQRTTE